MFIDELLIFLNVVSWHTQIWYASTQEISPHIYQFVNQ